MIYRARRGAKRLAVPPNRGTCNCGPNGAGHFVKMAHNGIEYGLMAAYAEGFGILRSANSGRQRDANDAESTPLRDPEHYQYDLDLRDIAEVWRRGSVVASWLLDLRAAGLANDPALSQFEVRVSDSGEGRWTSRTGPSIVGCTLPTFYLARQSRLSGQTALSDAFRLWWPPGKSCRPMSLRKKEVGHEQSPIGRTGVLWRHGRSSV